MASSGALQYESAPCSPVAVSTHRSGLWRSAARLSMTTASCVNGGRPRCIASTTRAARQPASTKPVGADSDKHGQTKDIPEASQMTFAEFSALPDATKSKMRGDYV